MTGLNSASATRNKPRDAPLVAAGDRLVADHMAEVAQKLGIGLVFVELDRQGGVLPGENSDRAGEVELLWCHGRFSGQWVADSVGSLPGLRWIHSDFVGVDALPVSEFASRGLVVTNGGDNFARPMAEFVMLAVLASAKRFPWFIRNSHAGIWDASVHLDELSGARMLLLGFGSVNRLVAEMCLPFGIEVSAWTRTKRTLLEEGVSRFISGEEWVSELAHADYVVVGLPLTARTRGLIGDSAFAAMKDGVTLINLARGAIVDTGALIKALDSNKIRYALFDAHEKEPLPPESPLWGRDNMTVLPHHSWSSPKVMDNTIRSFASELELWMSGRPLKNTVDLTEGY